MEFFGGRHETPLSNWASGEKFHSQDMTSIIGHHGVCVWEGVRRFSCNPLLVSLPNLHSQPGQLWGNLRWTHLKNILQNNQSALFKNINERPKKMEELL